MGLSSKFHISEQPLVSLGSCRGLSQLDKVTDDVAALKYQLQTRPDKVRHLLQWCITPLNKALGIKVGGVLENSGNSLFNGH